VDLTLHFLVPSFHEGGDDRIQSHSTQTNFSSLPLIDARSRPTPSQGAPRDAVRLVVVVVVIVVVIIVVTAPERSPHVTQQNVEARA
jgi:hypothetical protein